VVTTLLTTIGGMTSIKEVDGTRTEATTVVAIDAQTMKWSN
jgi:hypothetical protein